MGIITHPCPIHPNWVNSSEALHDSTRFTRYVSTRFARSRISQIDFRYDESTIGETIRVDSIEFEPNRQHFQPTLHSPPEVKIHEITIHEPSSFLKCGRKLQPIRTIRVDSIESTRIDNIFNPPLKSRSTVFSKSLAKRLPENDFCRFNKIGFTNRFPVCRVANTKDESTLVGCIGQPSHHLETCEKVS